MDNDLDLELVNKAKPKNNLNYKIKQVSVQIMKREQELKLLREKLVYLKCRLIEEDVYKKSLEGNDSNKNSLRQQATLNKYTIANTSPLGNEQMRSFML
jgi:SMC interacting uncharacterized protein involved in chromosome segregation